jgi:hypothetical protein
MSESHLTVYEIEIQLHSDRTNDRIFQSERPKFMIILTLKTEVFLLTLGSDSVASNSLDLSVKT